MNLSPEILKIFGTSDLNIKIKLTIALKNDFEKLIVINYYHNDIMRLEVGLSMEDGVQKNVVLNSIEDPKINRFCKLFLNGNQNQKNSLTKLLHFIKDSNYEIIYLPNFNNNLNSILNLIETNNESTLQEIEPLLNNLYPKEEPSDQLYTQWNAYQSIQSAKANLK